MGWVEVMGKVIGSTAAKSTWQERAGVRKTPQPSAEELQKDAARRTAAKEAALAALREKAPPPQTNSAMDEVSKILDRLNKDYGSQPENGLQSFREELEAARKKARKDVQQGL